MIFFDEIDSIASKRNNDTIANRMVAELLTQLDGINRSSGNVTVIAATNRPDILDRAIIRPGRFDEKIYVPLPDMQTRQLMFEKHLNGIPCQITSYVCLANNTEGFSGAEIEYVCEKAKQSVIRSIIAGAPENTNITEADIMRAISGVRVA